MANQPKPRIEREKFRTGLKVYEVITVRPDDSPEAMVELKHMLRSISPQSRVARIRERTAEYPDIEGVQTEMKYIDQVILPGTFPPQVLDFALRALERGLDLLDTGKYLDALVRDLATQKGRAQGAAAANSLRAKLPRREALLQEIAKLTEGGYRNERDAKAIVLTRYGVSPSALWQKLNPKPKTKRKPG